ncbi:response regulator [Geosporobacter ferrireducens]|uniref:Stage 0 sporulation protein A homolog n=1 Tax=Geosporobacter ferrireducens TaxID=1424294 RepID=A0A1D8GFT8_9FIRM|nr:response regulator [Geosporobacter ferrireducens]AOT69766.1 two-component system response regulator [Geosporobacter ferrireducens]MTI54522.1 response regulator [Geosporobacter ferrireducens]
MSVLIVDDAAFMRMTIRRILEEKDIKIAGEAANGLEAIKKYQELKPKVVTMDITMPEMDGVEAIRQIRKIDPNAKIIACSAMGQEVMVIEAIKAGAKSFVVKPFKSEKLVEELQRALNT